MGIIGDGVTKGKCRVDMDWMPAGYVSFRMGQQSLLIFSNRRNKSIVICVKFSCDVLTNRTACGRRCDDRVHRFHGGIMDAKDYRTLSEHAPGVKEISDIIEKTFAGAIASHGYADMLQRGLHDGQNSCRFRTPAVGRPSLSCRLRTQR